MKGEMAMLYCGKHRNRHGRKRDHTIRYRMLRDLVLAVIIGALSSFLPFWEWDNAGQQVIGGLVIAIICEIALIQSTEYTVSETIFFLLFGEISDESLQ